MWLALAFLSALLLGFYDVFKKQSLDGNAVLPVLLLNTLFSSLIFLPFILLSAWMPEQMAAHPLIYVPAAGWEVHRLILLKSLIVLSSWMLGYFGLKHLPITIVGPINATRPVMVLVGAMLIFGERLNLWQWIGVILAAVSFLMLSRSGRKEGIDFKHNRWIFWHRTRRIARGRQRPLRQIPDAAARPDARPIVVQSLPTGNHVRRAARLWWPASCLHPHSIGTGVFR